MKTKRDHLDAFQQAATDIWGAGAAIELLEGMRGSQANKVAQKCIRLLKQQQQRDLVLLDKAAALLGAPYPGKKPVNGKVRCQCGKDRNRDQCSLGNLGSKQVWFCDICIPL